MNSTNQTSIKGSPGLPWGPIWCSPHQAPLNQEGFSNEQWQTFHQTNMAMEIYVLFQHDIWNAFDFMADFLTILEYQNILGWYHQTHHIGTSKRHLFNPTSEFAVLALCCLVLITKGYHHLGQGTRKNHMCPAMDPKNNAFLDPENWKPRTSLAWSNSSKLSAKRGSCLANICHLISLKFWYQILQV